MLQCRILVQIRMEAACMSVELMEESLSVIANVAICWLRMGKPVKVVSNSFSWLYMEWKFNVG